MELNNFVLRQVSGIKYTVLRQVSGIKYSVSSGSTRKWQVYAILVYTYRLVTRCVICARGSMGC